MPENVSDVNDKGNEILSSQCLKVGAWLQQFWKAWERYQVDPWVLQVIREGYIILWNVDHRPPPMSPAPQEFPSYLGNPEKLQVLESEVKEMLQKGAIEQVSHVDPGFYNRLFLVPKPSGTWRPVLDVSRLNLFVKTTKFSMETPQSVLAAI